MSRAGYLQEYKGVSFLRKPRPLHPLLGQSVPHLTPAVRGPGVCVLVRHRERRKRGGGEGETDLISSCSEYTEKQSLVECLLSELTGPQTFRGIKAPKSTQSTAHASFLRGSAVHFESTHTHLSFYTLPSCLCLPIRARTGKAVETNNPKTKSEEKAEPALGPTFVYIRGS